MKHETACADCPNSHQMKPPLSSKDSYTSSEGDSDSDLPYPEPLPRSAFIEPGFIPKTYLSTLQNRHQTLEDLRTELRSRSQLLSRELLDLVNSNYQDFLGLGQSLKGGDEQVEEVRVGLLGFRKEVGKVRDVIKSRETEVKTLLQDKVDTRRQIMLGRRLLEFEARLKSLEEILVIEGGGKKAVDTEEDGSEASEDSEEEYNDDEDEDADLGTSIGKLTSHALSYRVMQAAGKGLEEHPFVVAQTTRITNVRNTLLLDLGNALQQTRKAGTSGEGKVMKILRIYADMNESAEAVKILKSLKP